MYSKSPLDSSRRRLILKTFAGSLSAPFLAQSATAAVDGPVKFVVNFPPGGAIDIIARELSAKLATLTTRTFIVENVAGAAGLIGAGSVARAEPDGRTLLLSLDTPFTVSALLSPKVQVSLDLFQLIAVLGVSGTTVAVNPALGVRTFAELVERGRRKDLTFATGGNGSPGHFGALLLASTTGMKIIPVHYKGSAPAVTAVIAGEVDAGIVSTTGLLPQIRAGKALGLATTGVNRSPLLPELPTVAELGHPGFTSEFMFVVLAPARTPEREVIALRELIVKAISQRDVADRLRALDIAPMMLTGKEALARLVAARERNAKIVRENNLKAE